MGKPMAWVGFVTWDGEHTLLPAYSLVDWLALLQSRSTHTARMRCVQLGEPMLLEEQVLLVTHTAHGACEGKKGIRTSHEKLSKCLDIGRCLLIFLMV